MSKTNIEWCKRPGTLPEVWNVVTGCTKVSQGCKNCYAEVMHKRLQKMMPSKYNHEFLTGAVEYPDLLTLPLKWKKPRTVFVNSMSDLFHEKVSHSFIHEVMKTIKATPQHTYIILTKRPEIMRNYFLGDFLNNYDWADFQHLWLGVSVEDQKTAEERIMSLLRIPCNVRFLSCEPLLAEIDLTCLEHKKQKFCFTNCLHGSEFNILGVYQLENKINWVIVGGESGKNARTMHPDWAINIKNQCKAANVPFFFKQWGEWGKIKPGQIGKPYFPNKLASVDDGNKNFVEMVKYGKHNTGNKLNGNIYQEFPKV